MVSTYREQMQIVCLDTNTEQDPYLRQPSTQRMATPELVCSLQRAIGNWLTPLPNLPICSSGVEPNLNLGEFQYSSNCSPGAI